MFRYYESKVVASGIIGKMANEWKVCEYKELDWKDNCLRVFYTLTINGDRITGEMPSIVDCMAILVDTFKE